MRRMVRLREATRLQHAAPARAVATTNLRPAATAARSPLVPLQQSIGNRAVGQLVQAKLKVGRPGDRYEREADRVADQVMRAPEPNARMEKHHAASSTASTAVPSIVHDVLRSPGQPLDADTRSFFEPRFGHDFGQVRTHDDTLAAGSARSLNASAYTVGRHIVLGEEHHSPTSPAGRQLMAHELTHVAQQSRQNITLSPPAIQRKPGDKKPAAREPKASAKTPKPTPAPTVRQKGLNRTLYVVQNDIWNKLPAAVRTSAEQQLNTLFAFVGKASTEKPFSIKIVAAAQLPEQFDFSESVVSVIRGDTAAHVRNAFKLQDQQIRSWLAKNKVQLTKALVERRPGNPERVGTAGGSKTVVDSHAMPIMAGAVSIDEVIDSFLEDVDSLIEKQLKALPGKGKDPTKWPSEMRGRTPRERPLEMLGEALGRAIAHEARHEYIVEHAEEGLGQDSPYLTGETHSATFSKEDQKTILTRIRQLEAEQGRSTVVPTFPQDIRSKPELFPF